MADVSPIPGDYPRLSPSLAVDGAPAAIDFYARVLGAKEWLRFDMPDGKVGHAELEIGDSLLMVSDQMPEFGVLAPGSVGGTPVTITVYVEDVDEVVRAALAAGATSLMEVEDQFYGDRVGQFTDPFGHRWHVATHVEDVSPEEMRTRMEAWSAG